jgi:nucleotide-binding universal stress UspA family protein
VLRSSREPVVVTGPAYDAIRIDARAGTGVVICVDDEASANQFLPTGLRWAEWLREPPIMLTVAESAPPPLTAGPVRRAFGPDDDVEGFLEHVVTPYRARRIELATKAVYDPVSPVSGLRGYLLLHPAALLVVGPRARTGLLRAILGSHAASFVRESTAPVLLVPRIEEHD